MVVVNKKLRRLSSVGTLCDEVIDGTGRTDASELRIVHETFLRMNLILNNGIPE